MESNNLRDFILKSLAEDIGSGDHSSLASIPVNSAGKARLLIKETGILAGIRVARELLNIVDAGMEAEFMLDDGDLVQPGQIAFTVRGSEHSILKSERLLLNIMQRMSGIATRTREYVSRLEGLKTKVLDTRKTTPGFRLFEKEAVRIGGGVNHRMGLYDMIMLKDNHIDYAGSISEAITRTGDYLKKNNLDLKIEIEARNLEDVRRIISIGGVDRIMLDNFNIEDTAAAVRMIAGTYETESSGGITLDTIRSYAECGVDFISVGALTHHIKSLDMSLKAMK
jgi:nicotinate-nucleotide pyrophosphorylase (carboxylating)